MLVFNAISGISWWPVHLSMLFWCSFNQQGSNLTPANCGLNLKNAIKIIKHSNFLQVRFSDHFTKVKAKVEDRKWEGIVYAQ